MRRHALAVGAALFCATAARVVRAEPAELSLAMRFGVSTAPFFTASFPSVRGHGLVAVLSGRHRLSAQREIGIVVPGALVSVEQPAGAYVDETTWGNPTLFVAHRRVIDVGEGHTSRWFGRVGLSLPLAEHGAPGALLANRALAVASALDGWREQWLYVPGRLSVAVSGGVDFAAAPWTFEASLAVPLLFEVSRAGLPEDADTRGVGIAPVVHAGLRVQVARWLVSTLGADLVVNALPPVEHARGESSKLQLMVRPALGFPLGRRALLSADFVAPIAGPLGGSTFSGSLLATISI
jgi:hypothetical protein